MLLLTGFIFFPFLSENKLLKPSRLQNIGTEREIQSIELLVSTTQHRQTNTITNTNKYCNAIWKKYKNRFLHNLAALPSLAVRVTSYLCESVLWSGVSAGRPMSRCCSRTCWRNSDTWYWRSSFSCRSFRCRANHLSSSLALWVINEAGSPVPTAPGPMYSPWPEIRPGTAWCDWTTEGWIPGGTGLGAGRAGSLVLSAEVKVRVFKMKEMLRLHYHQLLLITETALVQL